MSEYGIEIRWLSVTCFEMRFGGTTVVSDPFVTDNENSPLSGKDIDACDIITLSHAHWDHITDIPELLERFRPLLLCGPMTALPLNDWLDYDPMLIYPMEHNLELDFGEVRIRALFGKHTDLKKKESVLQESFRNNPLCADEKILALQKAGSMEYRNYLFTAENGTKVLLWGNDPTVSQRNLLSELRPEVAILQLSIQDPEEMAEFAAGIGCRVLIPHHLDLRTGPEGYMQKVRALEEAFIRRVPDGRFICPVHGERIRL